MWFDPILETDHQFGPYVRRKRDDDDSKITAILVLLGIHPGYDSEAPIYRRISNDHLKKGVLLSSIKKDKHIIIMEGKIIEIFSV